MRAHTITEVVKLTTIECYSCSVLFAMPETLNKRLLRDGGEFFCPNGHGQIYAETEAARLRKKIEGMAVQSEHDKRMRKRAEQEAEVARRQAAARKGQITKLKKRSAAGVCPVCTRSFENLRRHMQTKHEGFGHECDH